MLIAVNPFKVLHIYGSDAVDYYRGIDENADDADIPAHDDRATRCTTAPMPADIMENRRRSLKTEAYSGHGAFKNIKVQCNSFCRAHTIGWSACLIVWALLSGSSDPNSSPARERCVVFLGKTLYSHSTLLRPAV